MSLVNKHKYIFNIQTVQSGAFRVLVEALKDILTDCNFIFDATGIKLIATDNSHNVLIHMKLLAENFDYYECSQKVLIGVNMTNLFKLIKTMSNSDILTLFLEKDNTNQLGIQINNKEKSTQTIFRMNLLDIADENIKICLDAYHTIIHELKNSPFDLLNKKLFVVISKIDLILNLILVKIGCDPVK